MSPAAWPSSRLPITLVLLTCLLPLQLGAQTGAILTGRVTDRATGEAVAGARVFVTGTAQSATARQDGSYRLQLNPGTHEVRVTFIGYGIGRDTVELAAGEQDSLDFQLAREWMS